MIVLNRSRLSRHARARPGHPRLSAARWRAVDGRDKPGHDAKMKIYSAPLSLFGAKAEIAAHEKGIDFELVMVPFDFRNCYGDHHPDVKRNSPTATI